MKFHIPFTFSGIEKIKKRAKFFTSFIKYKKKSKLAEDLKNSSINLTREEYLGIIIKSSIIAFFPFFIFSTLIFLFLGVRFFYLIGFGVSILFTFFIAFSQRVYPRIYVAKRQRGIEKNLLPALQDMLIQLSSGIPLFSVMINIAFSGYGELSTEFKKAVRGINAGQSQTEVLEKLGKDNPSLFFRRVLWQISNGMKAGSEMAVIIRDITESLNEEQLIQIQNYGNKLNPLIMFYMLTSIIIPALSITFITILSSMLSIEKNMTMLLFIGLFTFVVLIQIMFLGLIKSKRPSLL